MLLKVVRSCQRVVFRTLERQGSESLFSCNLANAENPVSHASCTNLREVGLPKWWGSEEVWN